MYHFFEGYVLQCVAIRMVRRPQPYITNFVVTFHWKVCGVCCADHVSVWEIKSKWHWECNISQMGMQKISLEDHKDHWWSLWWHVFHFRTQGRGRMNWILIASPCNLKFLRIFDGQETVLVPFGRTTQHRGPFWWCGRIRWGGTWTWDLALGVWIIILDDSGRMVVWNCSSVCLLIATKRVFRCV